MSDIENAIESLIEVFNFIHGDFVGTDDFDEQEWQQKRDNIIKLLKKQEVKQAIKQTYHVMMNRDYENPVEVTRYDWLCPTCKSLLCRDIDVIDDNYHFCKVCGQAVKWDV